MCVAMATAEFLLATKLAIRFRCLLENILLMVYNDTINYSFPFHYVPWSISKVIRKVKSSFDRVIPDHCIESCSVSDGESSITPTLSHES